MQSSYSLPLVVLSYIVAVLASHVTLSLAQRLHPTYGANLEHKPSFSPWIVGGAFSMGTGIWSMHFIGMLAFHLPVQVAYDLSLTVTSWLIAVVVSGFALHRFHRNDTTASGIAVPGVFIGIGISAMHYTGMAAMQMFPGIDYDPLLFAASVLVGIAAAIAALWIAFSLPHSGARRRWYKIAAAAVMGAAIVGMHYTGMWAAHFAPNAVCISSGPRLDANWLAITIAMFTFLILGSTLLLSVIDAQLHSTIARSAEALRLANEALEQRVLDRTAQLQSVNENLHAQVAARRESQKLLQAIIDNSQTVVYVKDLEGRFQLVNRQFEQIFGRSRAEILGLTDHDLFAPGTAETFRELDARVAKGDHAVIAEETVPQADGLHTYISVKAPLRDDAGQVNAIFGISTDITERKRDEERLRSQLARLSLLDETTRAIGERQDLRRLFQVVLRNLEEHLPIDFGCACLYDPARQTLTVASLGVKGQALPPDLKVAEQVPVLVDDSCLSRCCVQGQLVYESDIGDSPSTFMERLGRLELRSVVFAPLMVDSKVFGVMIAARRAVSGFSSEDCEFLRQLSGHVALAAHQSQLYEALQRAYEDLRQTQQTVMKQERLRALGQMASGIAHDVNNALTPAALYLQSLLDRDRSLGAEARNYLRITLRAIEDVANTIARMREFYRPREAQAALLPVDLNRVLQQVLDLTRASWSAMPQERGILIRLQRELAQPLPGILGAESEIRDALTNLVLNAVDAMPEGGTLIIRSKSLPAASASVARALVEVCDTGIGMTEDVRNSCLEPFFTTKGERGTGLGLAMVYGMTQRHGADLEIHSEVGVGTTMRLIFPVAATRVSDVGGPHARPVGQLRILLVDDDPLILQSLRDSLEGDGHRIDVAEGGQAGIDAFRAAQQGGESFDLVITDLGMPHVDGRTVATTIKLRAPTVPVVLLTGWAYRLQAENDLPPHVDRVLSKPPKLTELRAVLAELTSAAQSMPGAPVPQSAS
ncbi:MAG: PAS domain-containing protein [Proteobacteria bacterium]|nr:PAS domain-containing protein [Pseudomonadota bacterium]